MALAIADAVQLPARRRWAYRLLTVALLLLLGLTLAEVGLRRSWTPPSERSTPSITPHELYGWAPTPGLSGRQVTFEYDAPFSHSAQGTRGRSPLERRAGETKKLLVLGDSHAYGLGCSDEETFSARVDGALPEVQVVNAGCNGYGMRKSLAVLHHLGEAWRPDAVLFVFFWNDLEDALKHETPDFGLDEAGRVLRLDPVPADFDPLAARAAAEVAAPITSGLRLGRFFKESLRGLRYRTLGIHSRLLRTPQDIERGWSVSEPLLRAMAARASELGASFFVAWLPDHNQIDPDAYIRNIEPVNFEVQERLRAIVSDLGVPFLDLSIPLRAAFAARDRQLFYYADRHMTPSGHAVVGAYLARELRAAGL
jgi:hypothetical protein